MLQPQKIQLSSYLSPRKQESVISVAHDSPDSRSLITAI